eukprot:m.446669 g.446669  ORF g.446669 m.446669 type:complete len:75 (-) comp20311_c3_seq1:125-349(-)
MSWRSSSDSSSTLVKQMNARSFASTQKGAAKRQNQKQAKWAAKPRIMTGAEKLAERRANYASCVIVGCVTANAV